MGSEPEEKELKGRGITAMLAERAAFIAGTSLDDRLAIDKDIREYYSMRGKIIHHGKGDVSLEDTEKFGMLVRRLALSLLRKLDELGTEINNIGKMENWVKRQKYTIQERE